MIQAGDLVKISDPKALLPKLYQATRTLMLRKYSNFLGRSLPVNIDASKNWSASPLQVVATYGCPKVISGDIVFSRFVVCQSERRTNEGSDTISLPEDAVKFVARPKFEVGDLVTVIGTDPGTGDYVFFEELGDPSAFFKIGADGVVVDLLPASRMSPSSKTSFYVSVMLDGDKSNGQLYLPDHMVEERK